MLLKKVSKNILMVLSERKKKKQKKAVVLAAGVGSRINEITKTIPKTMIKINGKFIFEYT